jgi:hypothetical protein
VAGHAIVAEVAGKVIRFNDRGEVSLVALETINVRQLVVAADVTRLAIG